MSTSDTTDGLSYAQAMVMLKEGYRAKLPGWNDESWMELRDGRQVMVLGGRVSNCKPRDQELLSWGWRVRK